MKVLIVKTSSMGDLIHTLPAVTDAANAIPDIQFDWVAEESFAEIPAWHPAIKTVFPIAIRRWRNNIGSRITYEEISAFYKDIKSQQYDYIIDAQGLIKSALVTRLAKGLHAGMNKHSCKEPLASFFFKKKVSITRQAHAIERVRMLFAKVLEYQYPQTLLDYGLSAASFHSRLNKKPYLVFLHGTSGDNKLWPLEQWNRLRDTALANGFTIYLPWGNEQERKRAEIIAGAKNSCHILPKLNLTEIAAILANASGVVGVDTGLAHLAAALSTPGVTIYVDTYPGLTGACGNNQVCISKMQEHDSIAMTAGLESVYSEQLLAEEVWQLLTDRMISLQSI
jgi:heptosyltransferase-1